MTPKDIIKLWREKHYEDDITDNVLLNVANNFADLTKTWFINEKKEDGITPTYELRFINNSEITKFNSITEDNIVSVLIDNLVPNNKVYKKVELVSIFFANNIKNETIIGELDVV
jgi:hypothetical protein